LNYGVNLPRDDEISRILFMSIDASIDDWDHNITIQNLFEQHNEHRPFFPRLVYVAIGRLTDLNLIAIMLASQVLVAAAYITICRYINSIEKRTIKYPMMLLIGLLLFSLVQYENMLWAWQVGFYMVSVFAILSIYFMHKSINAGDKDWRFLIISIICAIITSFSSLNGLPVWIAVAFIYLLNFRIKALKSIRFWIWNAFAVLTFIVYFRDFRFVGGHPSVLSAFESPFSFILYFFVTVGRSLSTEIYQSVFY